MPGTARDHHVTTTDVLQKDLCSLGDAHKIELEGLMLYQTAGGENGKIFFSLADIEIGVTYYTLNGNEVHRKSIAEFLISGDVSTEETYDNCTFLNQKKVTLRYFPEELVKQQQEQGQGQQTAEKGEEKEAEHAKEKEGAPSSVRRTSSSLLHSSSSPTLRKPGTKSHPPPPKLKPPTNWKEIIEKKKAQSMQLALLPSDTQKVFKKSAGENENPFASETRVIKTKYYEREALFGDDVTDEERQERIKKLAIQKEKDDVARKEEKKRQKKMSGVEFL